MKKTLVEAFTLLSGLFWKGKKGKGNCRPPASISCLALLADLCKFCHSARGWGGRREQGLTANDDDDYWRPPQSQDKSSRCLIMQIGLVAMCMDNVLPPKRKPKKSQLGQLPTMRGGLALELGTGGIFGNHCWGACARLHWRTSFSFGVDQTLAETPEIPRQSMRKFCNIKRCMPH